MENNNLRDPSVPYAVTGGTPPQSAAPPTPLFADVARSTLPAQPAQPAAPTPLTTASVAIPTTPTASSAPVVPAPASSPAPTPKKPLNWKRIGKWGGAVALVILLIIGGIMVYNRLSNRPEQTGQLTNSIASTNIPLSEFANSGSLSLLGTQSLTVNGQLRANESFVLAPQDQPAIGERGQLYYDNGSNQLAYYNGTQFIKLPGNNFVQTFQGLSGNVTLTAGNGLTINGTTFTNTGVTSVAGLTGDIAIGTGLAVAGGSLQATGVQSLTSGSATLTVATDGAGNLTITNTGAGTGTVTSGGGTTGRLAMFTGAQNIEDSAISQSGSVVTVNGDLAVTGTISLSAPLSVAQGGTGSTSLTANGVIVGNGSSPVSSVAAAGAGLCLMSTASTPSWQACPGGSGGVNSLNGLSGSLTLANASAAGSTITIDNASTSAKGIAQFNSTNFSVASGVVNTIQDIAVSSAPAFGRLSITSSQATNPMLLVNNTNGSGSGNLIDLQVAGVSKMAVTPAGAMTLTGTLNGQTISSAANFTGSLAVAGAANLNGGASVTGTLTANTITPTAAMTVGATSQTLTLQGSASTTVSATSGANTTTLSFQTPTANVNYRLLTAAAGTYDICTTVGNCTGVGGGVTTPGGTTNRIAKFTGGQTLGDSIISDNGTTVSITGTLAVNTITPTGALTIGATTQNVTIQGATTQVTATSAGVTNTLTFATPSGINKTITIPNATGTVVVSASAPLAIDASGNITCPTCVTTTGVTSLDGLTGALTIANSTGSGSTVTINDASTSQKGIAQFNGTNFSASSGIINTIQDIAITSAPSFGRLSLSSSQATNPMLLVNNTNGSGSGNLIDLQVAGVSKMAVTPAGAMTLSGTLNGQTISSAANFTGSLTVASTATLNGGATVAGTLTANTITPTAAMTVGATNQTLTLQGSASTTVTATSGANTSTLSFQTPTANVTYRLLTATAGTYDICTTAGNCVGTGGGVTSAGGTTNKLAKFTGSNAIGDSIITDNGSTVSIAGTLAVNTITPTGALTIGATGQNLTLQGATTQLTATSAGVTNTLTFATPGGGNKTITVPNATGTLVVSASAPLAIDAAGNISCPTCVTSTGVTSLDGLTGALTIANTSGTGSTITINDASTSQKGIAQFNSTNFSAASGTINTIQDIAVSSAPTFGRLTVTSSQASNGMLLVNNTNAGASGNLLDLQLSGASKFAVTPAGALTLSSTINGQTISSAANFTGSLAVSGAANLNGGATVTGTLTANTITPTSALTVGATAQSFTLQGNSSSTITATSGANTTSVSFQTPTANVTYRLLTAAAGTYDICTTAGNCVGVGGGVTTAGGTTNKLAKFTGSNAIGDSIITDNGTTVTIGGTLAVNTITPSAALTIGATTQNLTLQGATTQLKATSGGITNTLAFATPSGSNKTITLPNATGTVAVSASGPLAIDAAGNITCPTCVTSGGGGGGVGAVDSLDGLTGALTIANSSGTGSTITINDASTSQKGIAQFNSTNFSASSGTINTIQDIAVTSAPQFGRLTVTSSQASNAMFLINNTNAGATGNLLDVQLNGSSKLAVTPAGAMTLAGTLNGQTISSAASFSGTLAVASTANLNGGATVTGTLTANTITPTGSLTVGATNQSFLVQGSAASTITATSGANTTTLAFQSPTAAVTYRFLTAAAGTYDVCTTVGNCAGVAGGVTTPGGTTNKLAKFTGSQAIGDSIITDNGSTVTIGGTLAVNTLTPTAALTVGATSQNLTLQGATTNLTSTSGGITNTLTFATPTTTNKTITVPNASGTLVVSASGPLAIDSAGNITCATCATTSSAVTSLNSLTGALTIANASTAGSTITIDNASTSAKGIAQFNSTNFSAASGVINTIQNINTSAAPTFGQLTLTSSQASAAMLTVNNTNVSASGNLIDLQLNGSSKFAVTPAGAMTVSGTVNGQTISSAASFTGSLAVSGAANLNGGATVTGTLTANTITPTGALTVGATGQSFLLQGNASSTVTATNGANTTTLAFQSPTANVTYRLLTTTAGTYDICTSGGNCAGVGGGVTTAGGTTGTIALFTGSQAIGNSILTQASTTVTVAGTLAANTAIQAPLVDTASAAALNIGTTNATAINLNQNTVVAAGKSLTITGGNTASRPSSPTEGMLYYDTTTKGLLVYANGKWQADRSTATKIVAMGATTGCTGTVPVASQNPDGADYVSTSCTSAQTVINSAITALPSGGGVVYLMEGTYIIDGTINLPSNVTLTGAGPSTIVALKNNTGASTMIQNSDTSSGNSRITISNFKIDGNRANNTTGVIYGITMTKVGSGTGTSTIPGVTIANMTIENVKDYTVSLAGTTSNSIVKDSTLVSTGTGTFGLYDNSSGHNTISGNRIAVAMYGIQAANQDVITGNDITAGTAAGGSVYLYGNNVTFTGNTINVSGSYGGVFGNGSYNTVSGNTITGSGGSFGAGITNSFASTGWIITGNTIQGLATSGIVVEGTSATVVSNNQLVNLGGSGSTSAIIVQDYSGSIHTNNAQVTNNYIYDGSGTSYAIEVKSGSVSTYLSNNTFAGGASLGISDSSTSTVYSNQVNSNGSMAVKAASGVNIGGSGSAAASLYVQGGYISTQLATPSAPTLSTSGTAGSTSYTYAVTAYDGIGETVASSTATIATGNATLSGTNKINITVTPVGGAISYKIYRTASGGTPSSTGLIGTLTAGTSPLTFSDTGLAGSGAAPVANSTGGMSLAGALQGTTATFTTVNTNTITPSAALTIGATSQSFTLQGSAASTISATGGGFTTSIGFSGTPTGAVTYNFDRAATAGTYTICTTAGNCTGGSGVTTIGTLNSLTKSANGAVISGTSLVMQTADGTYPGIVSTGTQTFAGAKTFTDNVVISGTATNALTVLSSGNGSGVVVLNLQQSDADSILRVTDTGTLAIGNGTNIAGVIALGNGAGGQFGEIRSTNLTGARSYELPNSSGTFCLDNGNCGATTGTLQAAYNYSAGGSTPEIKLSSANNGIEIQDADSTLGSSQNFLSLRGPNGAGLGSVLVGFGIQGNLFMQPSANRTDLIDVNNNSGSNVFTVDSATSTGRVGIALGGSVSPSYTLDVGGTTRISGNLIVTSLGTAGSATLLCQNASNQIASCNTTGTGVPFVQGGNTLGAAADLGTNDANALNVRTNGTTRLTVAANGSSVTLSSNTDLLLQGATGYISNPQTGGSSESFGLNAAINANDRSTVVGNGANAQGGDSVAVGYNAAAFSDGIALGSSANCSNTGCVAIGKASSAGYCATAIGYGTSAGYSCSIALGSGATNTANNQLVIGSSDSISSVYIGSGVTSATPVGFTLQATGGSGANVAGADVAIASGVGTGTGKGGDILLKIAKPSSSGGSANSLSTVTTISGTNGSAQFKNAADSTTGFDILNAAGAEMFTIDTQNAAVKIGGGDVSPSGTPALLVLDYKNTAGDPTGVAGAMYYNSSMQQFRCYRTINGTDGNWEACGTTPIDRGWEVTEDFLGGYDGAGTPIGVLGQLGWVTNSLGTIIYSYNTGMPVTSDHPGVLEIGTPATANRGSTLTLNGDGNPAVAIGAGNDVKMSISFQGAVDNLVFRGGLHSQLNSVTRPVSGVWWEAAQTVNANWQYCYGNGTTATCAPTSVAVAANAWYRLEIKVNSVGSGASSVEYYINGTKYTVSGVTVDSGATVNPALACWTTAASDRYCDFDYYQFRGTASAAR